MLNSFARITILAFMIIFMIFIQNHGFAQADTVYNPKQEAIFEYKRFRVWNNWVSGGAGPAFHTRNPRTQLALGVNLNFHINKYYFRLGGTFSGDRFGSWNNLQGHAAYVFKRKENERIHQAIMAGLSYSTGYRLVYAGVYDNLNPYARLGLYGEWQWIRKINYDFGFGGAVFADINTLNQIIGLRLDVYFSGAYRGYVAGRAPKKNNRG